MGYHSDFALRVLHDVDAILVDNKDTNKRVSAYIKENLEDCLVHDDAGGWYTEESLKWYDAVDDLCKMSTNIQDVVFELAVHGEEEGDYWKAYILNGKSQVVQGVMTITYPEEFDITKLK